MDFNLHHLLQELGELLRELGLGGSYAELAQFALVSIGLFGSTGVLGYITGRRKFKRRTFFDQMVIGFNIIEPHADGTVHVVLRTLREDSLGALLDNSVLEGLVKRAARRCTNSNPIVNLKNYEDHALLLTKIQNAISERFAEAYAARMFGRPVACGWADFVVTCERYGGLKATKIRVLVFERRGLRLLLKTPIDKVVVEQVHHNDRVRTLQMIGNTQLVGTSVVYGQVEIPLAPLE